MKIYTVSKVNYDQHAIHAVFKNEERAKLIAQKFDDQDDIDSWIVEEYEVNPDSIKGPDHNFHDINELLKELKDGNE